MNERDRLYLDHILEAIGAAREFAAGDRQDFLADRKTQSAVVRQLEIIGEAVKHLSAEVRQAAPDVPWRQIAGVRDRLIHAYFQVDLEAVWVMVETDLPALESTVQRLRDAEN
jgi:uncharacterized protein with HEPN domain